LKLCLKNFDAEPGNEWKTGVLFKFIKDYYGDCVHHHHDSEEQIYNPWLEGIIKRPVDTSIKPEHKELMAMLGGIGAYKDKILQAPIEERAKHVKAFKSTMNELFKLLDVHFECEEKSYPKALHEAKVTQEEEGAKVGEILQSIGLSGNKKFLPAVLYSMCEWKGQQAAFDFFANLPMPIQWMCKMSWINDFYHNQLMVLEALKTDTPPPQIASCECTLM